jgi:amino acid transporter
MTKKNVFIILGIIIITIILFQSSILDVVLMFLFVGAIPGTSISIPPLAMLALLSGAIIAFTHWVAVRQLYPGSPKVSESRDKVLRKTARRKATKKTTHRKKVTTPARRRYSQLEA